MGQGELRRGKRHFAWMALAAASAAILLGAPAARGEIGEELVRFGSYGSGSGQLKLGGVGTQNIVTNRGGGIAVDPTNGHIFLSDVGNNRISEFTAWGDFVKAWGWGVADGSSAALQTCTITCFAGLPGSGIGQLESPNGLALGPTGDLYVFERENHRVQVFGQDGAFVRMFGGNGEGPGEFSVKQVSQITERDYIDIGPDELLYVGDKNRIQKFELDGTYVGSLPAPVEGNPAGLTVDPVSGDVYFVLGNSFGEISTYRLNEATGVILDELPTTSVEGITADPAGTVYVSDDPGPGTLIPKENPLLREIDSSGELVESCCSSTSEDGEEMDLPAVETNVVTMAGDSDLYVAHSNVASGTAFVEVRGPAPDKWPPPQVPPRIEAQFASTVGEEDATLKARINPNFWQDTRYYVEWGTGSCATGGCPNKTPAPPGSLLTSQIVKKSIVTEEIELAGLEANTVYHYRFVADSGGGGPVYGIDPDGPEGSEAADEEKGLEATFTTFAPADDPEEECANDAFRPEHSPSASLWECRAYEMVSPVDKLGGDVLVAGNINGNPARLNQAATDGNKVAYSSYRSFGDAESAGYTTQYMAQRSEEVDGWVTQAISPAREGPSAIKTAGLDTQYKAFTEDLKYGWLVFDTEPALAPGGVPGYPDLYRRDNEAGSYETDSPAKPTNAAPQDYNVEMQGHSADGSHTVFRALGKLTTSASSIASIYQTYEYVDGVLRLVSVKPGGGAMLVETTVGSMGSSFDNGRETNATHAVSDDGAEIYFGEREGLRRLFVRTNGTQTTAVSAGEATFWAGKPDGSAAIYTEAGALKRFELGTKTSSTLVASGVVGVMGQSSDLSRIYLVSTSALGGGAVAGKPNLYLYEEGQPLAFVATLSKGDLGRFASPVSLSPDAHVARVTEDGGAAIFMSRASLTGAENIDPDSGEETAEVFRYDAGSEELNCLSCNPTGASPAGRQLFFKSNLRDYWYASRIPVWEMQMHASRAIAADGRRVFFNSTNGLVPRDVNGMQDVYEWEAAGKGFCEETSPNYSSAAGGCVNLISTGKDENDSEFVDASAEGRDVFFLTGQSLLTQDPGQVDLYDAREGGGFEPVPPAPEICETEAECLPPPPPPPPPLPALQTQSPGEGNVVPPKRCRRGFVRKGGKCVKRHHKKKHHRHKHNSAKRGAWQ
jgi:NHL repeat